MKTLAVLLAALALAGCGTVASTLFPSVDRVVKAAPAIKGALDRDSAANPDKATANAQGKDAIDDLVDDKSDPNAHAPEVLTGIGALFGTVPGLAAVGGVLTALGGIWSASRKSRRHERAIDQHAALIDAATPESADYAAKVGKPAPAVPGGAPAV